MINFINWINIKINEEAPAVAGTAASATFTTSSNVNSTPTNPQPESEPSSNDSSKPKYQNGTMSSDIAKVPFRLGCCGFGCYSFKNYVKRKKKRKKKK